MQDKVYIVAIGSFNPPTFGHLRMLEDAKAHLEKQGKQVVGGMMSPVSDGYGKRSLVRAEHRYEMTLAATAGSGWIMADDWECLRTEWTPTLRLLEYQDKVIKGVYGKKVDAVLLVGGDVIETFPMMNPDGTRVWAIEDMIALINMGIVVQPREGSDPRKTIASIKELEEIAHKVMIIEEQLGQNTVSSTKLRAAVADKRSIKYATPDSVIKYIKEHKLYTKPDEKPEGNGQN